MNLTKTHFMQVRKSYLSTHSWEIKLQHTDTAAVTQTKTQEFLGVTIDEFFNWGRHINLIICKLQSLCYVFRKLVKCADANTVKTAYYGYVQSKLTYGLLSWGCTTKSNIERLFKKQKKDNQNYEESLLFGIMQGTFCGTSNSHCTISRHQTHLLTCQKEHRHIFRARNTFRIQFMK